MEEQTTPTETKDQAMPTPPKPVADVPKKKSKKFLKIVILIIVIAAIAGGAVWYYMNNKNQTAKKASDKTASTLNASISDLNKQLATAKASKTTTTTTTTTQANTNYVASLKTFCLGTNSNNEVGTIQYVENTNGRYGNCVVSQKGEPSGGMLISTYLSGKWTKIWEGNGVMAASNCTQYKIPKSIYEDCAGYYQ